MTSTAILVVLLALIIVFIAGGLVAFFLADRRRNQAVAHDQRRFEEQPGKAADARSDLQAPREGPNAPR